MGNVVNKVSNTLVKFIGKFVGFESGEFELSAGNHKFIVDTEIIPEKVWISTDETIIDGCGHIPINKIGCSCIEKQLVFEANIETSVCKIYWFAIE